MSRGNYLRLIGDSCVDAQSVHILYFVPQRIGNHLMLLYPRYSFELVRFNDYLIHRTASTRYVHDLYFRRLREK